jgi:ribonuclease G
MLISCWCWLRRVLSLDEESSSLAELQDFIGVPVKLQVEALYSQEQYDVVIV